MEISISSSAEGETFLFERIEKSLITKNLAQRLEKWGLAPSLRLELFKFDKKFSDGQASRFLRELSDSPAFKAAFPRIDGKGEVKFEKGRCTATTTDMFQKLQGEVVCKDNIRGRMTDFYQQIQISDILRECLLLQDSDHYCLFSQSQRKQLLLKLFQVLVLGGQMCQYEDRLTPYVQASKQIYKSVVQVRLDPTSQQVFAQSQWYELEQLGSWKRGHNPQSLLYVIVNDSTRRVFVLHNQWLRVW